MQKRIQSILSTTLIAFGLSAPALAQTSATGTPAAPAQTMSSQAFTDTQLENFISASREVAVISQEYSQRIESTTDQNERQQMLREADEKMVAAVQDKGITVDDFNSINQQLPQDPQLEQRVNNLLQQ